MPKFKVRKGRQVTETRSEAFKKLSAVRAKLLVDLKSYPDGVPYDEWEDGLQTGLKNALRYVEAELEKLP